MILSLQIIMMMLIILNKMTYFHSLPEELVHSMGDLKVSHRIKTTLVVLIS